jgi:hypothetical protein
MTAIPHPDSIRRHFMKTRILTLLALACTAGLTAAGPDTLDPRWQTGWRSITPQQPYEFCRHMVSPAYGGRFTGTPGYAAAARWAAGLFKSWGLKPISARDGFLQPYASPYSLIDKGQMTVTLPADPKSGEAKTAETRLEARPLKDFFPLLFSDSGQASGEAVFAGWGISAPELGYDDYAGVDVKGRFVLCFRGTPDNDKRFQASDEHRARMLAAQSRGALGLIYIYPEVLANPNGDFLKGFMPAMISEEFADKLLKEKNTTSVELKKALTTYKRPLSFALRCRIDLQVAARYFPDATGYNIAGYIEGSDPHLRGECIVLGGHFDHNGEHMGILFPGADDNASGSAVVMEVAAALARNGRAPKRSVMFVLFGGEEQGLKGSTYFTSHLPAMCKKVAVMLNFDMEGVGDHTFVAYSAELEAAKSLLDQADAPLKSVTGARLMRSVGVRGSDFAPFFAMGVPCASFFSTGPRNEHTYHLPADSLYRLNPDIMADISRLAYTYAWLLADR